MQINAKNVNYSLCLRIMHRLQTQELSPDMLEGMRITIGAITNSIESIDENESVHLRDIKNYLNDLKGSYNKPTHKQNDIIEC